MVEIIVALIGLAAAVIVAMINTMASNKRVEKKVDDIAVHEQENYLGLLRLTVMSSEMPTSERIIAGDKYIKAGGNGDVKHFYKNFLKTHTVDDSTAQSNSD